MDDLVHGFHELSAEEQEYALTILAEIDDKGTSATYKELLAPDWKWEVPSFREFIQDDYYAGNRGRTLYPLIVDELDEAFSENVSEVILSGAIGWGKSYAASFGLVYDIFRLVSMVNAQQYCGIATGTDIVMMNLSVTNTQAHDGLYKYVSDLIASMPVFQEKFPDYDFEEKGPIFPKEQIFFKSGGSTEFKAIGQNVIGGALDEANFMIGVRRSKRARLAGELDQAKILYDQIARRRKSRFIQAGGKIPSRFWLVSSVQFPGDFLEQRMTASKDNPDVCVMDHNQWETRMSDPEQCKRYSGKYFTLFVGNATSKSHILAEDSTALNHEEFEVPPGCHVIDVPVEYRNDFKEDLHGSIRDIAGKPTLALNPLFEDVSILQDCICNSKLGDVPREHPLPMEASKIIDPEIVDFKKIPVQVLKGKVVPRLNPRRPRYIHFDLSETGDATGVAIGHYAGHVDTIKMLEVPSGIKDDDSERLVRVKESRPTTIFDLLLKFEPPVGGRIVPHDVLMFVLSVVKVCGFTVQRVSYDQYQSADSLASWKGMGIETEKLSVDRTDEPYLILRAAAQQKRISFYDYKALYADCGSLQHDIVKKKVDHTPGGSKDVSDCVAAVATHIERDYPTVTVPMGPVLGSLDDNVTESDKNKLDFVSTVSNLNKKQLEQQRIVREFVKEFNIESLEQGMGSPYDDDGDNPWSDD